MGQPDHQNRSGCACRPMCDKAGAPVQAHRQPDPSRRQRLPAAATMAATMVVALNALVHAINVRAAWWAYGR